MPGHTFLGKRKNGHCACACATPTTSRHDQSWFDCTTADITQSWIIRATNGVKYRIVWGDGTVTDETANGGDQVKAHNYGGAGTYRIRFRIDSREIIRFYCYTAQLSGHLPDTKLCSDITNYFPYNNSFIGVFPVMAHIPLIAQFYLYGNSIRGTITDLTACSALVNFYVNSNSLTGYTASTIAATCVMFDASNNAIDLAGIDQILTDFTTGAGGRPGAGTIKINGGTNAVPTAGIKAACVAALPGWTITTN